MIALPIKNEKRGFDLAYCGIRLRSSVRGVQRNWFFLRAARRGLPKVSGRTPISGGSVVIVGALSVVSPNFLLDVRGFCWGLLNHRRFVDECVSIRPGQRGAAFLGFVVFGSVRAACSLSPRRAAAQQFAAPRLPRCGLMQAVCGPKPQYCRAALRRLPSCRLSRTRRA